MITVLYDGSCGLCSKEINHYIKIAPKGVFDWRDINSSGNFLSEKNISVVDALKFLHVINHNEEVKTGVDAFITIWSQIKNWKLLAKIVSLSPVKALADIAYSHFAQWRFNRLTHCQIAEKKTQNND